MPNDEELIAFRIRLTKEQLDALERLQALCGHATIEETIHAALSLYGVNLKGPSHA